mmetsp:Transcript_64484/g.153960  ORF Transcript_64484/g.153960 Transcript_64484/m.153960 type:complete len:542 (+) Transcript_64484:62-1687(+)
MAAAEMEVKAPSTPPAALPSGRRPSTSRTSTSSAPAQGLPPPVRVTETAGKLGEDALRAAWWLRSETSTPERTGPQALRADGTQLPPAAFTASVMSAADIWRTAFHAEAMECVKAMAAVVEGRDAGIARSGSVRPEECRRAELKASAQLKQHVKEMTQLNEALKQFLSDSRASGNLQSFTDSLAQLTRLNAHVDEQHTRWTNLDWRMTRLQEDVHDLRNLLIDKHAESNSTLNSTAANVAAGHDTLASKLDMLQRQHESSIQDLAEKLQKEAAANLEATRDHMQSALAGPNPVTASLEELKSKMLEWEAIARAETAELNAQVSALQENLASAQERNEALNATSQQVSEELESLKASSLQLSEELTQARTDLEVAQGRTLGSSLLQLKLVESRGNVKLNRDTGALSVLRPLEFTPCQPADGSPEPRLADPDAGGALLEDVATVIKLFDTATSVEVQLKDPKGLKAPPEFFTELQDASAGLVQAALLEHGAAPEMLTAKGTAGKRGASANSIAVKLNGDFFAAAPGAKGASAGSRAPSRPKGK